jgi:hypothetical protein
MRGSSGGGWAVMICFALHASGPAGVVQRCPGVPAVDGSPQEREEGRDGGVWSEGPGARTSQRRAIKAWTRRSGAAQGRPQLDETAARHTR